MTVEEVFAKLEEEVAPVSLSDEFCAKHKLYDNSGIILNCGKEVTGVLFALDLSLKAVKDAEKRGFNLIVTHHPAIYGGISRLDLKRDPLSEAIAKCIKKDISVISMHLNFDAAPEGIDYHLARGLGGNKALIAAPLSVGGYGRVSAIAPRILGDYFKFIKKEFATDRAVLYGDSAKEISRVASFCGAGCDETNMNFAAENGADLFVSADMKHHEILALTQKGIAVIVLTHYASENYGFEKIYRKIKEGLKVSSAYFTDADML